MLESNQLIWLEFNCSKRRVLAPHLEKGLELEGLRLESRVKLPYIHHSRYFLEQEVSYWIYRRSILKKILTEKLQAFFWF